MSEAQKSRIPRKYRIAIGFFTGIVIITWVVWVFLKP